jgi:hypothetical protein
MLSNNSHSGPSSFHVDWDGASKIALGAGAFGWTQEQFTAIATSSTTTLAFYFNQSDAFFYMDNVTITAVPEPAEYAAVTGLALVVFALVQRRCQAAGR